MLVGRGMKFKKGPEGILVLSAASSSHTNLGGVAAAGWDFNSNGTLQDIGTALTGRTDVAGEYYSLEPETDVGAYYEVRCASMTVGTWNTQAATVGTWINLSAGRLWFENVIAMAAPSSASAGGSFEIGRVNTSTAIVTATLTAFAQN